MFRRYILPFLILPFLAVMLVSCESLFDAEDGLVGNPSGSGSKLSLSIYIKTTGDNGQTRADSDVMTDGEHFEHEIGKNGNFAIFFNENKNFYGVELLTLSHEEKPDDEVIEAVYTTELKPESYEELPKYCLIVLNGGNYFKKFSEYNSSKNVNDVLAELWESNANPYTIGRNDEGLFTMTNSIYFDTKGQLQSVVELNEKMIYDKTDPKAKAEAEKLVVYVERMLGKFTFNVDESMKNQDGQYAFSTDSQDLVVFDGFNTVSGAPKYVSRDFYIEMTGWNVNGLETCTYLFKNIKDENYFKNWTWRKPEFFRTFWSIDQHYEGEYPLQYRKSVNEPLNYYEDFENRGVNQLKNYSYNDMKLDNTPFNNSLYVPENTYNYDGLKASLGARTDLLAGTHVIVGARLRMLNSEGNYLYQNCYRDREGFFYLNEKDCLKALVYAFNAALTSQNMMRFTYYTWGASNQTTSTNGQLLYAKSSGEFNLYYNGAMLTNSVIDGLGSNFLALATIKSGDGRRMPWPKTGTLSIRGTSSLQLDICDATGKFIRKATEDDIKSLIFEWIGAVDHFDGGRMYYVAPALIEKGLGNNGTDICGVVRNNWYNFNLVGIDSFGTPVDDINQPIVPDPLNNNDQLNLTVHILGWHTVQVTAPILP